ncbi:MAG: hypothetical protein JXM70_24485 [Pirellulales bacterium]|nr:hypothetical protein [Pirellulales bacterium]
MSLELVLSNVVIAARQFNPSVIGQLWLVRNGLLGEDDFLQGCYFTDMAVQIKSREFDLMVVPPQCQFSPRVAQDQEQNLLVEKVGTIAKLLSHTPYQAIGLNFTWHLIPEDTDVHTISREWFYKEDGPLHREFDIENARYGAYMSKDAWGGRLKLDVKPVSIDREGEKYEIIQFAFNFHRDVVDEENPVACIEQTLRQWNNVRDESSRIAHATITGEPA